MKLGLVIYSNDAETVWNAFRLGVFALKQGDTAGVFLLAKGVEAEQLDTDQFKCELRAKNSDARPSALLMRKATKLISWRQTMDWQEQLITIYLWVCKQYRENLWGYCERRSNYADLSFSDAEVITIYLFGIIDGKTRDCDIYRYTDRHLRGWFPRLPS